MLACCMFLQPLLAERPPVNFAEFGYLTAGLHSVVWYFCQLAEALQGQLMTPLEG